MNVSDTTKEFWSKGLGARLYRRFAGGRFFKMHQAVADAVLIGAPTDVLDIACGPGDFLAYLSSVAPDVRLSGSDLAPGMVAYAKRKLEDRAYIVEASGGKQPFAENSFDVITIMMAFHHFPDKVEALRHIGKLLRPSGKIIIADVVARSSFQKKFWNVAERVISIRGYIDHYTKEDFAMIANEAGFDSRALRISNMPKRYTMFILNSSHE